VPTTESPEVFVPNPSGIRVTRLFTKKGHDPLESFTFVKRPSKIAAADGTIISSMSEVEVPDTWDQTAVDILVSKYLRKAGVPQYDKDGNPLTDDARSQILGPERSLRQVIARLTNAWTIWGQRGRYFATEDDLLAYRDEMGYMLCAQMAAPNSPVWFNVGLFEAYGIIQTPDGSWYVDPADEVAKQSTHRYERTGLNACFISRVEDELVGPGSIFEFAEREARLFSQGSGSGANMSLLRAAGEPLSAGGVTSGVLSFMKFLDEAAGAIKSGGTTRRAAKMVILDAEHPEVLDFVWAKAKEEKKAEALIREGYGGGYEGEAVQSVAFQNANHSVRLNIGFMQALADDGTWEFTRRTDGSVAGTIQARDLFRQIAEAAWQCADPGLQFDDIINDWNTAADTERLRGTNPCFPGSARVHTDRGLVSFNDLIAGVTNGETYSVWTHNETNPDAPENTLTLSSPDVFMITGVNPIVELEFSNGATLRCTPTHKIFTTNRGFVPANELAPDDHVKTGDIPTPEIPATAPSSVSLIGYTEQEPEVTYNLSEPINHSYIVDGIVVRNCSEYTHVDDTACNLASLNLVKFYDDEIQTFNVDAYEHAARLWALTLEIQVSMSHYPARVIAEKSYRHRTTGLGYANLGALLMRAGLPYDDPRSRSVMAALTSIMHNQAYATSAETAAAVGPAPAWTENKDSMARVIRNHARAALGSLRDPEDLYEELTIIPQEINHADLATTPFANLSSSVISAAKRASDAPAGYRNMQVTVLAPTGCVVGSTLVDTTTGLATIESLGDIDGPQWQDIAGVDVATGTGIAPASQFYVNGVAETLRVTTSSGRSLVATPEHRIRVIADSGEWAWARLADLQPRTQVPVATGQVGEPQTIYLLPPTPETTNALPPVLDDNLSELIGYYTGTGYIEEGSLILTAPDVATRARLVEIIDALGLTHTTNDPANPQTIHVPGASGQWLLNGLDAPADQRQVPKLILRANNLDITTAFLRGLFATASHDSTLVLTTYSTILDAQVRYLLGQLGIRPTNPGLEDTLSLRISIDTRHYLDRFLILVGLFVPELNMSLDRPEEEYPHDDLVPLPDALASEIFTKWGDLIPTFKPHLDAFREIFPGSLVPRSFADELYAATYDPQGVEGKENTYTLSFNSGLEKTLSFLYEPIISVEPAGTALTYDLSVPGVLSYVANGFVSHNTIGLVMGCDTTGVEPDFALVKNKKLAGGGYMRIVNESLIPALEALGYDETQIGTIITYALGTQTLHGPTPINGVHLRAAGLPAASIDAAQEAIPTTFDLAQAFAPHIVGAAAFAAYPEVENGYELLLALGFSAGDIAESSTAIYGHLTVEGSPDLLPEHLAVFDCAVECGDGTRSISYTGHVAALGAVAPHISGSVSKTVNLPTSATVEDIEDAFKMAYRLGVKCVAIYRNESKVTQPLSSASSRSADTIDEVTALETLHAGHPVLPEVVPGMSPSQYYAASPAPRFRPPNPRLGVTWRLDIGGQKIYLHANTYPDGTPAEVFIDWGRQGSTLRGVTAALSIAISHALQHGTPLSDLVNAFRGQTFEPNGVVSGHENLKFADSVIDAVARVLGHYFEGRDDLVQVKGGARAAIVYSNAAPTPQLPSGVTSDAPGVAKKIHAHTPERLYDKTCSNCGSTNMERAGSCFVCRACGETTGCS
jgi:ribonucleotide reductase alpha subunit